MGVAFTGVQPQKFTIRCDTSAHLRADLDAAVFALGWLKVSTLTNGFIYSFKSRQGLVAHCRIQDTGGKVSLGPFYVDVQFQSADDLRIGYLHKLVYNWGAFSSYQAVVGPCQIFISAPGVVGITTFSGAGDAAQNSVAGGIPFIPQNVGTCSAPGALTVTECWWSSGPTGNTSETDLRSSRYCTDSYSVCYNGVLYVSSGMESYSASPLQIGVQAPTNNVDSIFHTAEDVLKYSSHDPLLIDAPIIFRWRIIGVVWDAFVVSKATAIDNVVVTTETDSNGNSYTASWIAYNYAVYSSVSGTGGGTHFGTLYILYASTPAVGSIGPNYAY